MLSPAIRDFSLRETAAGYVLMALFFLLVRLEIKREVMIGELSSSRGLVMPPIAA